MNKKTIRDVDVAGKRVLVRVDFNVPIEQGRITDDTRIRATLPTIQELIQRSARVILLSHLGRPDGKVREELRLAPVAERLAELLGQPVHYVRDCLGPEVERAVQELQPGEVLLLENVRFYPEEEKNDPEFARRLAALGDLFVNDAFGAAHRAHASTAGIAHYLPAVAGLLMERELEFLSRTLEHPRRPFTALIGGAKVSTKIKVLDNLLQKVDRLLIGGGMANTFLKAQGYEVGRSLLELEFVEYAAGLLQRAQHRGVTLLLPVDAVVAPAAAPDAPRQIVDVARVPSDMMILDIGPRTVELFAQHLRESATILWNGPVGLFEVPPFAEGTRALAEVIAEATRHGAISIVGGGDTVAAVEQMGLGTQMTHLSTGG
ncbi:MAG: phosphoglycerate kinase, partial [Chloroflexota bacterium]